MYFWRYCEINRSFEAYTGWDLISIGVEFGVLHNAFPFLNFFFLFVSLPKVLVFVLSFERSPLWTCAFYEINLWLPIKKKKKAFLIQLELGFSFSILYKYIIVLLSDDTNLIE